MIQAVRKVFGGIDVVLQTIQKFYLVIAMIVITAVIFWAVVCRYILYIATPWAEELARYLFITMCYVGSGYCISKREHIEINVIAEFISKTKNAVFKNEVLYRVGTIIGAVYLLIFGKVFLDMWFSAQMLDAHSVALNISMLIPYSIILFSILAMIIQSINLIIQPLPLKTDAGDRQALERKEE